MYLAYHEVTVDAIESASKYGIVKQPRTPDRTPKNSLRISADYLHTTVMLPYLAKPGKFVRSFLSPGTHIVHVGYCPVPVAVEMADAELFFLEKNEGL